MKVVVTGGSGFLGSHIADALTAAGHETTVFDVVASPWLQPKQKMVVGSVLDEKAVEGALRGCDIVYHLAALADIDQAINRPRETVEVNVLGTLNLLEAARLHKLKRVVFASTIYVYSDQGSFYRTSKQACENLLQDYHERFGLDFTVLRFGSLYGPRADSRNGVFRLLSQALADRRIDYHGSGEEVREYIHILDAAAMSVDILSPEYVNQYIHLTGRERLTSRDILKMIGEILGGNITTNFSAETPAGHYVQTPYNYTPKLGRRLSRGTYIDLGLGLLDCVQQMAAERRDESAASRKEQTP